MDLYQRHLPHHVSPLHIPRKLQMPVPSPPSSLSTGSSIMWSLLEMGPSLSGQIYSAAIHRLLCILLQVPHRHQLPLGRGGAREPGAADEQLQRVREPGDLHLPGHPVPRRDVARDRLPARRLAHLPAHRLRQGRLHGSLSALLFCIFTRLQACPLSHQLHGQLADLRPAHPALPSFAQPLIESLSNTDLAPCSMQHTAHAGMPIHMDHHFKACKPANVCKTDLY